MATDFRAVADRIASDIASGRLRPGDRLPPQREFADQHKIAVSTTSRVYRELHRRGLVVGEVGRGTYVRTAVTRPASDWRDPPTSLVNLELNQCVLPEQAAILAASLAAIAKRPALLESALELISPLANGHAREAAARFLSIGEWKVDPDCVCFAGSGKQALAAAISAVVPVGERLGVDSLTYPLVKSVATGLGVELVPIAYDAAGMRPDALEKAHRKTALRAVYCQPTLHNPLGITMPAARRADIARVLGKQHLVAIEDHVYSFLDHHRTPLAAIAPTRSIVLDSMSKRVAPGVTIGFAVAPRSLVSRLAAAVRAGAWGPTGLAMELSLRWIADGTAERLAVAKRQDAIKRQRMLRTALNGLDVQSSPVSYHAWLNLPEPWRAERFVAAAAQRAVAVTPAAAFAVGAGHAPNAVRIALATPPLDHLASALQTLATLARETPVDWNSE